jgi:uncharacterized protein
MRIVAALLIAAVGCQEANTQQTDETAAPEQQGRGVTPSAPVSGVKFDTASASVVTAAKTIPLHVEIAARADQRAFGLMDRDQLAPDAGMIFLYDSAQPGDAGFWMYRTRIPLGIAFFDSTGKIVSILQMVPCTSLQTSNCPSYSPNASYFGALEVNANFFEDNGVKVGDRIVLPGRIGG